MHPCPETAKCVRITVTLTGENLTRLYRDVLFWLGHMPDLSREDRQRLSELVGDLSGHEARITLEAPVRE